MSSKKIDKDILLVCTGAGNVIQGGADIWVNNFSKKKYGQYYQEKRNTNY